MEVIHPLQITWNGQIYKISRFPLSLCDPMCDDKDALQRVALKKFADSEAERRGALEQLRAERDRELNEAYRSWVHPGGTGGTYYFNGSDITYYPTTTYTTTNTTTNTTSTIPTWYTGETYGGL